MYSTSSVINLKSRKCLLSRCCEHMTCAFMKSKQRGVSTVIMLKESSPTSLTFWKWSHVKDATASATEAIKNLFHPLCERVEVQLNANKGTKCHFILCSAVPLYPTTVFDHRP